MWTAIKKIKIKKIFLLLFILYLCAVSWNLFRENPEGTEYRSSEYIINPADIEFLYDLTYKDASGKIISDQKIFDRVFSLIDNAEKYILLDMFLFNSYTGSEDTVHRNIAYQLVQRLVNKKKKIPDIKIDFITDPINTVYGGARSDEIDLLKAAGINVILTDLHRLRDSNVLYSPVWRLFFQWFGNSIGGFFSNPFSGKAEGVSLRSYLELLNFKANHRKLFVCDYGSTCKSVITSANPHDGSSAHSNVAFEITGAFSKELIEAERAVAEFSETSLSDFVIAGPGKRDGNDGKKCSVMLVTENNIEKALLENIKSSRQGDRIDMGMFYLSDRNIIKALIKASDRGAVVRIILDPNKDAFGRQKNGIPNRQAARELIEKSEGRIKIRWYDTHGEQYHSKLTLIENRGYPSSVILGSANLTRRNLENYNLELDVCYSAPGDDSTIAEVQEYFNRIWNGAEFTTDYSSYEDKSGLKKFIARFLEASGASTF
ncbi:MAG: phospholipase D-like domain-containing protein [Desulfobacteraceae bacterium]|jgi:phosphatidylserine/phosphatidylglycerophosphate/cardiolipin synthase-like enzyme